MRHDKLLFRQRFSVVADAIARGLGCDMTQAAKVCRKTNMFLDDLERLDT